MAGRPTTTGTKRTEKLTIFLSPDMLADIQDLSSLHGKNTALCVVDLITKYINSQREELKTFRELRKKLESKEEL